MRIQQPREKNSSHVKPHQLERNYALRRKTDCLRSSSDTKENDTKTNTDFQISNLLGSLRGDVIGSDDPMYDDMRRVFFTGFDRRPAAMSGPEVHRTWRAS
jgi:hypothetical protein